MNLIIYSPFHVLVLDLNKSFIYIIYPCDAFFRFISIVLLHGVDQGQTMTHDTGSKEKEAREKEQE